jgi:hypothetical protein
MLVLSALPGSAIVHNHARGYRRHHRQGFRPPVQTDKCRMLRDPKRLIPHTLGGRGIADAKRVCRILNSEQYEGNDVRDQEESDDKHDR